MNEFKNILACLMHPEASSGGREAEALGADL